MGTVFELISDTALIPEDAERYTECQVCEKQGVAVYPCQGNLILEDGEKDEDYDVYYACEGCIKDGRIEHIDEYYLNPFIARFATDPESAQSLMRRTPRCPTFVQDTDWPICCGSLSEYTGEPTREEAEELDRIGQYWCRGPGTFDSPVSGLVPREELSVLGGVSAFRCHSCGKKLWIFQFT